MTHRGDKNGNALFIEKLKTIIDINDEQRSYILDRLHHKTLEKSEHFLKEGQICNAELFIKKGLLRTYFSVDGAERIMHFSYEGHWVCDYSSFINQEPSKTSIQAIENTELIYLYREDENEIRNHIPNWEKIANLFLQRLVIQKEKLATKLMTTTAENQYADLLQNRPELIQRIPQYYLAQYVGVQPESLSRIKKRLQQK